MYIHPLFEELVANGRIFRRVFSKYTHPPSRPNILALQTCACNNSCHVLAHAIAANVVCLPNQTVKWKETRDHAQPHLSMFCQGGQLHRAMVAVGGSYEHWASPVADFDGCLVLHRDLYHLLKESEKCWVISLVARVQTLVLARSDVLVPNLLLSSVNVRA